MKNIIKCLLSPLIFIAFLLFLQSCGMPPSSDHLQEALEAARWIQSAAVPMEVGTAWPAVPAEKDSINNTLYSGVPGVVLFFLEAAAATGNADYLDMAGSGADYLISRLQDGSLICFIS